MVAILIVVLVLKEFNIGYKGSLKVVVIRKIIVFVIKNADLSIIFVVSNNIWIWCNLVVVAFVYVAVVALTLKDLSEIDVSINIAVIRKVIVFITKTINLSITLVISNSIWIRYNLTTVVFVYTAVAALVFKDPSEIDVDISVVIIREVVILITESADLSLFITVGYRTLIRYDLVSVALVNTATGLRNKWYKYKSCESDSYDNITRVFYLCILTKYYIKKKKVE